jgi:hypothetical protein
LADVVTRGKFVGRDVEHVTGDAPAEQFFEQVAQRLGRRRVAVSKVFQHREVFRGGEDFAVRGRAIATGAADLLRVVFHALREVVVIDRPDIRFVDTHAEGDRRNDDGVVGRHESILHRLACLGLHARVIGLGGKTSRHQRRRDGLGSFLQRHVNNRRSDRAGFQPSNQHPKPLAWRARRHAQKKVGPIETRVNVRLGRDGKRAANVLRNRGRRRGREREHAAHVQLLRVAGELQVIRPEIVAPLGNAVRLVDHEQIDAERFQVGEKPLVGEPLGRDVEEF